MKVGNKIIPNTTRLVVSFAAVFRDVTQRSPERKFLSGERCVTSRKTVAKETTSLVVLGITKMLIGSISHLSHFQLQWDTGYTTHIKE